MPPALTHYLGPRLSRSPLRSPFLLMHYSCQRAMTNSAPRPRTAIVTGAARGIGRAIALRLARDGYAVAVNDLPSAQSLIDSTVSAISSLGVPAYGHAADVSSATEVSHLVSASVATLGPLDVMVANAGVISTKAMMDVDMEDWETVWRVNVGGVHNCFKAGAREMVKTGTRGRLIAASSVGGFKPWKGLGH